jgi:hypothetical protein
MLRDERGVYRKAMNMKIVTRAVAVLALATLAHAQGVVNGQRSVLGRLSASGPDSAVDFTAAGTTAPVKTGTLAARPAGCTRGEMYFATDVAAGQNLYLCTATGTPGTWTAQGGSGGANGNSGPCSLASSLGFQLNGTDETTLLNSTIAGGLVSCLAIDAGKTLRADGQVVLPTSGGTTCVGTTFRITGAGAGGWGPGTSTLDLRYHGSGIAAYQGGPKILALGFGTLQIDNVTIADNGTDCAAYVLHTMSKLLVDHATFNGRNYPYTGACNDAIVTGGTAVSNAPTTCTIADWAGGQAVITNTSFSGMARAWWARSSANGAVFENNWIQGKNLVSPFAAIDIDGYGPGASANSADVIANNLIEQLGANYQCGIHLNNAKSTMMYGNQFWDGGTYSYCLGSNLSDMSVLSSYSENGNAYSCSWPAGSNLIRLGLSNPTANQTYRTVGAFFDGGASILTGSTTRCANVPFAGTINEFSLTGDQSGTATVTVKAVPTASYTGPSSTADISGGGETVTNLAQKIDTTLSGWTTPLAANTTVCFTLSNPSAFTWLSANFRVATN